MTALLGMECNRVPTASHNVVCHDKEEDGLGDAEHDGHGLGVDGILHDLQGALELQHANKPQGADEAQCPQGPAEPDRGAVAFFDRRPWPVPNDHEVIEADDASVQNEP
mmetsp:Transcript_6920/g.14002  ORF Transcript_6920/g.14002 Transcript_6920/m.14002 type:complete len:109 (-) Transcript_6920:78-404(-)